MNITILFHFIKPVQYIKIVYTYYFSYFIEHGKQIILIAYADDIAVVVESEKNLKRTTEKL